MKTKDLLLKQIMLSFNDALLKLIKLYALYLFCGNANEKQSVSIKSHDNLNKNV